MRVTTVPFSGFYCSDHSEMLDWALEDLASNSDGEICLDTMNKLGSNCDWARVHLEYAKAYLKEFAGVFSLDLTFDRLHSPREYNFETDQIFARIPLKEVRRIWKEVPKDILQQVANERHTSRPGFVSFYSPDFVTTTPIPEWDHHMIGTLLQAWVTWKIEEQDVTEEWETEISRDLFGGATDFIYTNTPGIDAMIPA